MIFVFDVLHKRIQN